VRFSGVIATAATFAATLAVAADSKGLVVGVVDHGDRVRAVSVVDRQNDRRFPGSIDRETGNIVVGGLPLGQTYDCIIDFTGPKGEKSTRLEGVNLTVPRSDYVEEQPLSDDDVATIQDKIRTMNRFEDVVEILAVKGNIQHAAVVLNKLRTKPFYDSKPGEVVWRLELWHYERPEETWHKVQDEMFVVMYRERIPRQVYDEKSIVLDPALGGLRPVAEEP
jgi:hypothetical protein